MMSAERLKLLPRGTGWHRCHQIRRKLMDFRLRRAKMARGRATWSSGRRPRHGLLLPVGNFEIEINLGAPPRFFTTPFTSPSGAPQRQLSLTGVVLSSPAPRGPLFGSGTFSRLRDGPHRDTQYDTISSFSSARMRSQWPRLPHACA